MNQLHKNRQNLMFKLLKNIFGNQNNFLYMDKMKKSDFKARVESSILPKPLEVLFRLILKFEVSLIIKGIKPPFGLSVFCIAEILEKKDFVRIDRN